MKGRIFKLFRMNINSIFFDKNPIGNIGIPIKRIEYFQSFERLKYFNILDPYFSYRKDRISFLNFDVRFSDRKRRILWIYFIRL